MSSSIHAFKPSTLRRRIGAILLAVLASLARGRPSTGIDRWTHLLVAAGVVLAISSSLLARPVAAADTDTTFSVSNGVSADDASYVTEGLALARRYLAKTLSEVPAPLTVNVRGTDDSTGGRAVAFYGGSYIVVFTGSPGWTALSPFDRVHVVVHEFIHAWQHAVLGEDVDALPAWFLEGMAEYLSYDAVAKLGLVDAQAVRDYHRWSVASSPSLPALRELQRRDAFYNEYGPVYSLAFLAFDAMVEDRPISDFVRFMDGIRLGQSWRTAFAAVLDQRVEEFYDAFELDRSEAIAPLRAPKPFGYALPTEIEAAVAIDTVPRSVTAGDQLIVLARSEAGAICAFELTLAESGGSLVATTFADTSGRVFWLVTIPPALEPGGAMLSADCGAEPESVEFQIAAEGASTPRKEAA